MESPNIRECKIDLENINDGIRILESQIEQNNNSILENDLELQKLKEKFNIIKQKKEIYYLTLKRRKEQAERDEIAKKAGQYIEPSNSKRNKVQKMSLTNKQIYHCLTKCVEEMAVLSRKIKCIEGNNNKLSSNNEQNLIDIENKNKQRDFYSKKLTDLNRIYRESLKQNRQQKQEEHKCNIEKAQKNLEKFLARPSNKKITAKEEITDLKTIEKIQTNCKKQLIQQSKIKNQYKYSDDIIKAQKNLERFLNSSKNKSENKKTIYR